MPYSSEVLADSPLAYYRLDETSGTTMADSSGNGRAGAYVGGPSLGQPALLNDGLASIATSSGKYAQTPYGAWMQVSALTVEAWIRVTDSGSISIVARHASVTNGGIWDLQLSAMKVQFRLFNDGFSILTSATTLALNTTYYLVGTHDGTNRRIYINGVLDASDTPPALVTSISVPIAIGAFVDNYAAQTFTGRIDEVAVYGTALSSARIAAHYTAGTTAVVGSMSLAGTVQGKVASFTLATVAAVSLAATVQPKVASFTLDAPPNDRSVQLAATVQPKVASFELATQAELTLSVTVQPKSAQFVLSNADRSIVLAATVQPKTASFALDARPSLALAATVQSKIATFVARALVPVVPAPASVAAAVSVVVAKAHGPVAMQGTQPVYAVSKAEIARARQQIVVDGVDITYFRDVPTPDVDYTLLEPLLYGPGNLEIPQVSAWSETFGVGDLTWLRPQAPVEVHLVVDDAVVLRDVWKGFVAAFDLSGATLSLELGGEARGRAAMRDRQYPIFPRINDLGHQIADAVRDLGLPHHPPLGAVTGIEMMTTGGTGHDEHIDSLVAKSWTRSGKQWTVMPDPSTGVYETHRKDAATIHATAFLDAVHTVGNLRRDIAEEPNQIFVTCVTPSGKRVRFGKYPGLVQGPVPDFPGVMSFGDTGEGVRLLIGKLHASGYLRLADVAGGFDADVDEAVRQLQDDAGLLETGVVNLATWRALYDLDITGLSLEWANIQPAAQRSKTRKFNRSANGTIIGFNDEYDPEVIVRHRTIDLGSGVTRRQAREFARTVLHDSDSPNWVGDITFNTGALIRGTGTVGMALAPANVMDARELRPGMNLWLPQHDGGTLVHVSACRVSRGTGIVTATVDTRFRDAMEVWQVIARNKESRNDPSRHRLRRYRASTIVKDSIGEWDEFGGMLGVDLPLERGWNKFPVVAAMEGQIRELTIKLANPAEFAVAVWGQEPDVGWLNETIPHPLTISGTKAWETKQAVLSDRLLLWSAGTHSEPCGYWPGRKKWKSVTGEEANPDYNPTADSNTTGTDDQETVTVTTSESFGTVTGKHVDAAGFPYFAADRKVVWVTVWVRGSNTLPLGRIMKPQLEAGA